MNAPLSLHPARQLVGALLGLDEDHRLVGALRHDGLQQLVEPGDNNDQALTAAGRARLI